MVGMLTIPWTMTAELFPTEIRGLAHSISFSIANLLMFSAVQNYRNLTFILGGKIKNTIKIYKLILTLPKKTIRA